MVLLNSEILGNTIIPFPNFHILSLENNLTI